MRPLYSSVLLMLFSSVWIYASPSDILALQPRIFFFMIGTIFSHICCRLIVAQMSNTRCEAFDWLLFPTFALSFASIVMQPGAAFEVCAVYVLAILATLTQIHYGVCVVSKAFSLAAAGVFKCASSQH